MRTTVRLDDGLLAAAKAHAARMGKTLTAVLEDALRTYLALEKRQRPRRARKLPTYGSGGLRSGVDLDNSADLMDIMEGPDAAR